MKESCSIVLGGKTVYKLILNVYKARSQNTVMTKVQCYEGSYGTDILIWTASWLSVLDAWTLCNTQDLSIPASCVGYKVEYEFEPLELKWYDLQMVSLSCWYEWF